VTGTAIAERVFKFAGAVPTQGKAPLRLRGFDAAKNTRLNQDFPATTLSADQELRHTLKTMRGRSRFLRQNNPYFGGYCHKLETNVVGKCGIKAQVNAKDANGKPKVKINRAVEDAFEAWCRPANCDVEARLSFRDIQALVIKTIATDGESLVRKVNDGGQFKLQVLDVDWLREDFNERLENGNRIVMSVEMTNYGKVVAYWFFEPRYSGFDNVAMDLMPKKENGLRIPAEQIIHLYVKERAGQSRGIPWTHSIMLTLNHIDGFDEAELVGARIGASNMAFVSAPAEADPRQSENDISTEVNPGQVLELPPGYTVHDFSPSKPLDAGFSKRMLRKVAAKLGVNYNSLTPDLEGVNFSSIRAGEITERDGWQIIQEWLATYLCQPVFESWLMFQNGLVPVSQIGQVLYPNWQGRGFDWVDPLKDAQADILAMDRGILTMEDVLKKQGKDLEKHIEQLAYEAGLIENAGLVLKSPASGVAGQDPAEVAQQAAETAAANRPTGAGK
jgi:lambda family phage portal protein